MKKVTFRLLGEGIDHVEEATLLGVTITITFNSRSHLKMTISKSDRLLLLSGTNCMGCKLQLIMQLYKQFVGPVLEYGAIA